MSDSHEKLQQTAEHALGTKAFFDGFFAVEHLVQCGDIWEGIVNQFSSGDRVVYAWQVKGLTEPQYVTMLREPPINTALDAVRTWIASQTQEQ